MTKRKFAFNIIRYRWYILTVLPLFIVVLFAINIKNAGIETNWRIWFDEKSQIMKNFDKFRNTFGSDDRILVALRSENGIFHKEVLINIQNLTNEFWNMKNIARVDSLSNFQYSYVNKNDEDVIIVEDFLKDIQVLSKTELLQKEKIALSDNQIKNLFISRDGKSAMIIIRMIYSEKLKPQDYINLYHDVNTIIDKHRLKSVVYHNVGMPAFSTAFAKAIQSNFSIFIPLLLGSIALLFILIFRNLNSLLLTLTIVVLATLFIAGFTFALGYKLNTLTSMFPIFVIAIGIADSIHIYWTWLYKRKQGISNTKSVVFAIEKNVFPAFITSITTFVGFLSLAISKIVTLQAFGILVATGAVIAFILSITFLPAFLSVLDLSVKTKISENKKKKEFINSYVNFLISHHKKVIVFCFIFIALSFIGLKNVSVDTQFLKQFSEDSEIRKSASFVEKYIGGTIPIEIIVDSKKDFNVNNPKFLQDVENFSISFQKEFAQVRHITSLIDVVKKYNKLMQGDKEEFYEIPKSKELISQYLLLYSLSLPQGMGINDLMDVNKRYLRVTAMINLSSEEEKLKMYRFSKNWWEKNSEFSASIEGMALITAHMRTELTKTMIKSISVALILVTIIFYFTFKSRFFMAISAIPNIAPLLVTIGLIGWFGLNVDLSMAIVFIIIIGVAIDDTVHFLSKYQVAFQRTKNTIEAIQESLLFSGSAIIITTLVLVLGFGIFLFSNFALYSNFGLMSGLSLFLAMVFDLLLLPAILIYFNMKKREYYY